MREARTPRPAGAPRVAAACALALAALGVSTVSRALPAERPLPSGLGFDVALAEAAAAASAVPDVRGRDVAPPVLRVRVPWNEVEKAAGTYDFAALDAGLEAAARRGASVVLVLTGPSPAGVPPVAAGDASAFVAFATATAAHARGRVAAHALWEHANDAASWAGPPSVRDYAFLLKKGAIAVRGADPGVRVASGALRASATFLDDLLEEGVAPFLDAYGIDPSGADDWDHVRARLGNVLRDGDPSAALLLHHLPLPEPQGESAWRAGLLAREGTAALVTHDLPPLADEAADEVARALETLARAFPPDATPAVSGGRSLVVFPGEAKVRQSLHVVASDLSSRLVYATEARVLPGTQVVARVTTDQADAFRLFDPTGEHDGPVGRVERGRGQVALWLPLVPRPLVLAFDRVASDSETEESVEVAGRAQLSVEEILARHLAVQAAHDQRVDHYVASLQTEMRYLLGTSGQSVEIRVDSRYYHDAHGPEEIENLRFFLNGAPYEPKKRVPEIPLLQPEKVTVVPLDVHLDRTYSYRLEGLDDVDGRRCYRVAFEPGVSGQTRYAGQVWIDAETFDRRKIRQVQTALEPPVLSNEQVDHFGPVAGADGKDHWLVTTSESRRVVSVLGASVAVDSRMSFDDFVVNGPDFGAEREAARSSSHQMLRDTDEGLRYLRPVEGGGREVAEESSRKVLAIAGARYDSSYENVLPLGGVNWLDNDLAGTGLQSNFFIAGALNTVSIADPSLWGSRLEGSVELFAPFVGRRDRLRLPGAPVDESQGVKVLEPTLELGLGMPVGHFGKLTVRSEIAYQRFKLDDETAPDFRAPSDGFVTSLGLVGEHHRTGWNVRARVERWWRHDWDVWGPGGGATDPQHFTPGDETYWTFGAGLDKAWFFRKAQTFSVGADWFGGSGLDRFSQYEFQALGGPRVAGFEGSGIHFDEAAVVRLGYGVDVAGLFGLKLSIEGARIENDALPQAVVAAVGDSGDALGLGIGGTLPGPWGTIVSFDVGWAVHADDYPEAEGNLTAQVLFLKLIR